MAMISPAITSVRFNRERFMGSISFKSGEEADRQNLLQQLRNVSGDLVDVTMDKLSRVVVIAGPNGSGKSRTLRLAAYAIDRASHYWPRSVPENAGNQEKLDHALFGIFKISEGPRPVRADIAAAAQPITTVASATIGDLKAAAHQLEADAGNFNANFPRAAHMMQRCFTDSWDATHPESKGDPKRNRFAAERWADLRNLISSLLRKSVTVNSRKEILIGGMEIDEAIACFSEGERRLFGLAVSLVGEDVGDARRVIFCDEPENHLHPEAAVDVLTSVRDALPTAQLWIATHSVAIISAMGWENVWVAESGSVSFSGRNTARIVSSLLGGRDNIERLRAFMDEPDKAALAKFTEECLRHPPNAPFSSVDPQFEQILSGARSRDQAKTKILDWGAGRGRFAYWLRGAEDRSWIDYYALSLDKHEQDDCATQLAALYNDGDRRLFRRAEEARDHAIAFGGFDFVVLANVLHEVSVGEWPTLFAQIQETLADRGILFLLEDAGMRIGELPTHDGFLLVTETACDQLFAASSGEIAKLQCQEEKYADRLLCFRVPKELLARVTIDTVRKAVHEIGSHSLLAISSIRTAQPKGYDSGNKHALFLTLYANAALAEKRLADSREPK